MADHPNDTYFTLARKYSKLTGLMISKSMNKREEMLSLALLFTIHIYSFILSSMLFDGSVLNQNAIDLIPALGYFMAVSRITIIRYYRTELADILTMMEELEISDRVSGRKVPLYIQKYVKWAFQCCIIAMTMAITLMAVLWNFQNNGTYLPFGAMPVWVVNYSFTSCAIFQIFIFAVVGYHYTLIDALKVAILLLLEMYFKNLKDDILSMLEKRRHLHDGMEEKSVSWRTLRRKVKEINCFWNSLDELCRKTEHVFNLCVLSTVLTYSIYLCITLMGITYLSLNGTEFWTLVMWVLPISPFLICDCYVTQRVVTQSEEIATACYNVDFVGTDLQFQKAVMFMLQKAQRPVTFTIGKFATFSIVTILVMARATFSYFTFLQSVS